MALETKRGRREGRYDVDSPSLAALGVVNLVLFDLGPTLLRRTFAKSEKLSMLTHLKILCIELTQS